MVDARAYAATILGLPTVERLEAHGLAVVHLEALQATEDCIRTLTRHLRSQWDLITFLLTHCKPHLSEVSESALVCSDNLRPSPQDSQCSGHTPSVDSQNSSPSKDRRRECVEDTGSNPLGPARASRGAVAITQGEAGASTYSERTAVMETIIRAFLEGLLLDRLGSPEDARERLEAKLRDYVGPALLPLVLDNLPELVSRLTRWLEARADQTETEIDDELVGAVSDWLGVVFGTSEVVSA